MLHDNPKTEGLSEFIYWIGMWLGMFSVTDAVAWYVEGQMMLQIAGIKTESEDKGAFCNQKGMK